MKYLWTAASIFLIVVAAIASEKTTGITLADAPEAVRKSVLKETGKGKVSHIAREGNGEDAPYVVDIATGAARKELNITPSGKVTAIKEPVTLNRVPPEPRKVIRDSVGKGKILSLQTVKVPPGVISVYEVRFLRSGKISTLKVPPTFPRSAPEKD